jgi:ABC-2 type transport system permease protein
LVVAVPAKTGDVKVIYDQKNANRNAGALAVVRAVVDNANLSMAGVSRPALKLVTTPVRARTSKYYDFLLPGLVGMGVMNFAITGMGIAVTRFREQQILKRILATPLRPARFLAAQVGARLVLSVVQAAVILAVGMVLFHGHVYGNILWMFVLAVVANLAFLNIGFAIAGRAPNPDAAQGMGQAVAIPMMFLSGVFFPLDTLPNIIHTIVRYLPLTPLLEALRKISIDGASITATGSELGQLGIWVVVTFLIASRSFRFAQE